MPVGRAGAFQAEENLCPDSPVLFPGHNGRGAHLAMKSERGSVKLFVSAVVGFK